MTKAVFLWLSVGGSRASESAVNDVFTFLSLEDCEEDAGLEQLRSFCEAAKYLRARDEMVEKTSPLAIKLLKETGRLKAMASDLPLTVALLTDVVRRLPTRSFET